MPPAAPGMCGQALVAVGAAAAAGAWAGACCGGPAAVPAAGECCRAGADCERWMGPVVLGAAAIYFGALWVGGLKLRAMLRR